MLFRYVLILLALVPVLTFAQPGGGPPTTFFHKDTLKISANAVGVRFSHMTTPMMLTGKQWDVIDLGSDGAPGKTVTVYLANDSIQIRNDNFPFEEKHYFPLELAGRKYKLRLRFNSVPAFFPADYIRENRGRALVEIPETFELANILLLLSPTGPKKGSMIETGPYHEEVMAHFKSYLGHPVFKALDVPEVGYVHNYYEFRENSMCYQFSGDKLVPTPYFFVYGSDDSTFSNAFRNNIGLVEDFAKTSKFREFYQKHLPYYRKLITRQAEWSDVPGMQRWLSKEFARKGFDTSKLIFSPIIYSRHSTQQFAGSDENRRSFEEMLLFVNGPEVYTTQPELNDQQRRGLLSGTIFTEVDHNYVNPRTADFALSIDSIFADRDFWAPVSKSGFYTTPVAVFNEYMTHALFSLYALDTFDEPTAKFLIARRETMNAENRGFVKFREFNTALIKLKKENADKTVAALYPKIVGWCREFAR
ncbi:protein of unknown function [Dyadobacter soli]|uniref:DUF4932 domain-containing protein n=1 Tax=Dyadobacter soli TaxID=659014 RepID=A0A1G7KZ94_9BACT|nr:DUF4932 domain-containing protein [Dyadobacter soli]SDF42180.1 protein of unknown function [Dyadobacter soli]